MKYRTLSSSVYQNFNNNLSHKFLTRKVNNKWHNLQRFELINNVNRCRDVLKYNNIKKGDRIAYKGNNSIEWLSWNLATNSLGGIWVPMYSDQNLDYCNHIVNDCKPKLFISDNMDLDIKNTRLISKDTNQIDTNQIDTNQIDTNQIDDIDFIYNDISTLIYTSGTTGKPKGVMLSNENILNNIDNIKLRFPDLENNTSLNILPWAHIYSQTCELYYNLLSSNNKIVLASSREEFIKECREVKPDVLYVVPRVLDLIKDKMNILEKPIINNLTPYALSYLFGGKLKTIFTGGAKLNDNTKHFFKTNNIILCEGYGCTETSPMVSVNHLIEPRKENSIGKILDDVSVEIVNNEIQVSGPNIMLGYWNNKNETDKVLIKRDGKIWYKTGDSGCLEDDYLYFDGRISENYKLSNGKFVNVPEVESKIKELINGNFIIFGENMENNNLIVENEIDEYIHKKINSKLDSYLKINKVFKLDKTEFDKFLTPKMSIKRKELVKYVIDNYQSKDISK